LLTFAAWVIAEFDPDTGLIDMNASFAALGVGAVVVPQCRVNGSRTEILRAPLLKSEQLERWHGNVTLSSALSRASGDGTDG